MNFRQNSGLTVLVALVASMTVDLCFSQQAFAVSFSCPDRIPVQGRLSPGSNAGWEFRSEGYGYLLPYLAMVSGRTLRCLYGKAPVSASYAYTPRNGNCVSLGGNNFTCDKITVSCPSSPVVSVVRIGGIDPDWAFEPGTPGTGTVSSATVSGAPARATCAYSAPVIGIQTRAMPANTKACTVSGTSFNCN